MTSNIQVELITQIVAIDGPAGAGKSTVARRVAGRLRFSYLDTGAMYRAATWRALHRGVDVFDPMALAESTRAMQLDMRERDGRLQVLVDGEDVTDAIRTPDVTKAIHFLDSQREVRAHLVRLQQAFGWCEPTVAEGRDIGTVVFPNARCKIFMTASLENRADRRCKELAAKGLSVDFAAILGDIRVRDERDSTRQESPLRRAADAVLVDTTTLTIDEAVETIVLLARERL